MWPKDRAGHQHHGPHSQAEEQLKAPATWRARLRALSTTNPLLRWYGCQSRGRWFAVADMQRWASGG